MENRICLASGSTFDPARDFADRRERREKNMDMIGHDREGPQAK